MGYYFEVSKYHYLPMRKYILSSLDRVYSISSDGLLYTRNLFNSKLKCLKLSRLGVEKNSFQKADKKTKFLVVSCSNIINVKRVKLIAESIKFIRNQDLTWIHFGDGPLKESLLEYCENNFNSNLNFRFQGRVSNKEILNFYRQNYIDLFINLSSSEGIPVSIMEAMSFGIPVIATNVGGTSEIWIMKWVLN